MSRAARAAFTESSVVFGGFRTRVLEVDGTGPTLILMHGFTDSADTWRPLLTEFSAMGRRAVAVDLPGHGRADEMQPPLLESLDRFTNALVEAYAAEGPVILAGNSLGGLVALRAATRKGLPLAAVAGLGPAGLAHHLRLRRIERLSAWLHPALSVVERLPMPSVVLRNAATVFAMMSHNADLATARRYASHFRSWRDLTRLRSYLVTSLSEDVMVPVEQIGVPVLLIWGGRDRLVDVQGADRLLSVVPRSRLVIFERSGHVPQHDDPAQVARLLADLPASAELAPGSDPALTVLDTVKAPDLSSR